MSTRCYLRACFIIFISSFLAFNNVYGQDHNLDKSPEDDYYQGQEENNDSKLVSPSMLVVNTWNFTHANSVAWHQLNNGNTALDAIERGCSQCEIDQCDGTVGWGGSPDENGETTLDALIMDGMTYNIGAVANLRRIKNAISVARKVLENTNHTLLVGDMATKFAIEMGFKEVNLTSKESLLLWQKWHKNNCQPNYWQNVKPNPKTSCGPYLPVPRSNNRYLNTLWQTRSNSNNEIESVVSHNFLHNDLDPTLSLGHDTIGMVAIDSMGRVAAGTSTNGLKFKIPGRVGDSPIPGAGAYADKDVGGAAATGDGDVMMRFLLSYQAVENLRNGMTPNQSADDVIRRLMARTRPPYASAAVIVVSMDGKHGASCSGFDAFPRVVSSNRASSKAETIVTKCLR